MTNPDGYALVSGDYTLFDGIETVTLTTNPATGSSTAVATVKGLRVAPPIRGGSAGGDVAGELLADSNMQIWVLYRATLGSIDEPEEGMKITDSDGVHWIIEGVRELTFRSRYRCLCRKARTQSV